MKKFCVTYQMSAKYEVHVEAENLEEAEEKAEQFMADADFGPCENLEWKETDAEELSEDSDEEDDEM